jgi:hypothetical protein
MIDLRSRRAVLKYGAAAAASVSLDGILQGQ